MEAGLKIPYTPAVGAQVLIAVGDRYGVTPHQLVSKCKEEHINTARMGCYYLLRELTDASYPCIGDLLNRDHSSVSHGDHNIRWNPKVVSLLRGYRVLAATLRLTLKGFRGAVMDQCPYCGDVTKFTFKSGTIDGPRGEQWFQEWDECDSCHAVITPSDWAALEEGK